MGFSGEFSRLAELMLILCLPDSSTVAIQVTVPVVDVMNEDIVSAGSRLPTRPSPSPESTAEVSLACFAWSADWKEGGGGGLLC